MGHITEHPGCCRILESPHIRNMMWLYGVLLLVASALGQRLRYLPAPPVTTSAAPVSSYIPPVTPASQYIPPTTPSPQYIPPTTPSSQYIPPTTPSSQYIPPVTPASSYIPPVTPAATYIPPVTPAATDIPPTTPPPRGYLPPSVNIPTVTSTITKTNTLTAEDCRTEDKIASITYELINQQLILVTQCTKNVLTETIQRTIETPVNSQIVIRSTTTQLRPRTTVVTDIGDRLALTTVTDTTTATMTHRANQFLSTTINENRTEKLNRTTLVISTNVNKRTSRVTTTQTVLNTIVLDTPRPAPAVAAPRIPFAPQ